MEQTDAIPRRPPIQSFRPANFNLGRTPIVSILLVSFRQHADRVCRASKSGLSHTTLFKYLGETRRIRSFGGRSTSTRAMGMILPMVLPGESTGGRISRRCEASSVPEAFRQCQWHGPSGQQYVQLGVSDCSRPEARNTLTGTFDGSTVLTKCQMRILRGARAFLPSLPRLAGIFLGGVGNETDHFEPCSRK